ncbi:NACHT, LRR and PYD domains-containing protein 10 [Holothuria leucospilota]|uniref:NACHT, LRR and PYD domains-containing protein 10 n=1 Tax=Holothuria leucospilota TaxID=206669 RepID=A0A9Q0YGZ3_HOLLE|nr:NACHT, LRR and PYD domains-containing protein 10 [Holothuria leucospilota]
MGIHYGRYVSFIDDDALVSCLGDKLEVFQVNKDEVLRSRRVNGRARCLSVRERREIFIGFEESNKITVYDVIDLNEIKSIILQGIQDGYYPYDMTAIADRIFVCISDGKEEPIQKSLIFEEKNGRILWELTKPTDTVQWYAHGLALNITLNVIAVAWSQTLEGTRKGKDVIVFYSLLSENNCSFLIVEVEFDVYRIRISDRGDRIVWINNVTDEIKVFDMSEFFSYGHLKENLQSQLPEDDCFKLTQYFALPDDQRDEIFTSDSPTENLLLALEEKGVIQPSNVDRLAEAFTEVEIKSSCSCLIDFYQKTRLQATPYGRFLATLSAHLTASLPADLCLYFDISDENKSSITSSPDPGLSLLLALDETGIINPSEVEALEQPFSQLKLVQAEAKIQEYQLVIEEERNQLQRQTELTEAGKKELFIQCLQRKIHIWYETMTPVPWKKSCRWKSTDLFVGSGLVLTDSKAKRSLTDIDEECKLQYNQILNHNRLKAEKRIILEGEPGSGKTMMSSQLAYDWSQGKIKEVDVLIFLPLKFVNNVTLVEAAKRFYCSAYDSISVNDIESFLTNEDFQSCLILDGFEEYNSAETTPAGETSEVTKVMEKSKFSNCKVILTSRSDYAKDLPTCPMLRIGRFGEKERNTYIEKVFADNTEKQQETKRAIENTPFILDLCSVPLLFVLAVHNIESMVNLQEIQLDRVSPFMENMVRTLCSSSDAVREQVGFDVKGASEESQLEEFAYNGLCKGRQVLSWRKDMLEKNITNLKELLDSGVLVVEEGIVKGTSRGFHNVPETGEDVKTEKRKKGKKQTGIKDESNQATSGDAVAVSNIPSTAKEKTNENTKELPDEDDSSLEVVTQSDSESVSDSESPAETESDLDEDVSIQAGPTSGSTAKHFPLEVKFLHKVMQEWYAAKYLSSLLWKSWIENSHHALLRDILPQISPMDLHYTLRFTSYLCPPSCYLIIEFLLQNHRTADGAIPEYILNCACLCFAEYNGIMGLCLKDVVSTVCAEIIPIRSGDSRLIHQSKVALMRFAASVGILMKGVQLIDVISEVGEKSVTFTSGVVFDVFNMIQVIEMSRWDQHLEEKDYGNILKLVLCSHSIRKARLHFPSQPPVVNKEVLEDVVIYDKTVEWIIGPRLIQTLNRETGKWEVTFNTNDVSFIGSRQMGAAQGFRHGSSLNVEKVISIEGGYLEIPDTDVSITFPPDAFHDKRHQCLIQMRIIPRSKIPYTSSLFASNSTVTVELLPNNLRLKHPAKLTLPHCLHLKKDVKHEARIFMSHHEENTEPQWEEISCQHQLDETKCTIWLNRFCWTKFEVDGELVDGKRIKVYTAARKIFLPDDMAEIQVGYHLALPGEEEILRSNKHLILAERKPYLFLRDGGHPLNVWLERVIPKTWEYLTPDKNPRDIPFDYVAAGIEYSCPFPIHQETKGVDIPYCMFMTSQNRRFELTLNVRPEVAMKMEDGSYAV